MIKDNKDNFKRDNKRGRLGECIGTELYIHNGHSLVDKSSGYEPRYDAGFIIGSHSFYVEFKTDYTEHKNVAIEFKSRGKPSGINSTSSDIYAVVNIHDKAVYSADVNELREYIKLTEPSIRMNRQNDSETYIYTIPKKDFIQHFQYDSFAGLPNIPSSIEEAKAMADAIPDGYEDIWTLEDCAGHLSMRMHLDNLYRETYPSWYPLSA